MQSNPHSFWNPVSPYSTLLPTATATHLDRAGVRHGTFTPPRISPSCPQCLWLWLGRSIIVGQRGLGRGKPPQLALRTDGRRSSPYLAVFYSGVPGAGGLGASSTVLSHRLMYPDGRILTYKKTGEGRNSPFTCLWKENQVLTQFFHEN